MWRSNSESNSYGDSSCYSNSDSNAAAIWADTDPDASARRSKPDSKSYADFDSNTAEFWAYTDPDTDANTQRSVTDLKGAGSLARQSSLSFPA